MKLAVTALVLALLAASPTTPLPDFRNIARQAGLSHNFPNGGAQSKRYIVETTGSGAAFFDYDNDGFVDALVLSGPGATNRLYRNLGNSKFADVTRAAGLESANTWSQGVCAGDFDNDGFTDLFITAYGPNRLYRNAAGKRFEDVTARSGLSHAGAARYHTGCAFLDFDNDGDLDLYVSTYLKLDLGNAPQPGANPYCYYRDMPVNCGPRGLPFDRNIFYRNDGRTFTDVSAESGIAGPDQHYSLGVVTGDFNNDGFPDLYVACDRTASLLYINQRNGTFAEEGLLRGVALDEHGAALSGMGVAAADYDHNGWADIFRTNFSDERETLYKGGLDGNFEDVTAFAGMAHNTRFVGWGAGFFDFDNDMHPDLLLVNGHVFPEVDKLNLDITHRQRPILYRNLANGKFEDISERAGAAIADRHSSRGAIFADIDNDGSVEVLINHQNEPPSLLRNHARVTNHNWIVLKLAGTRSNRSAIGAKVRLKAGGVTQSAEVRGGGSYLSQNDLRVHFGLGTNRQIDEISIRWPAGQTQTLSNLRPNRVLSVTEESGPPQTRQ